jgi:DNA-directed RNA polymerase specialized sigma24 family protein
MAEVSDRVERLLALLLIQELRTQREKIVQLNVAGFTNTEIADLLQTTSGVVSQELYAARKGKKSTAKKKS